MSGSLSDLWKPYLPATLPDKAFQDLNQTMAYQPLNIQRLLDAGAIRITDPGGNPNGEGWSLVTRWNDAYPGGNTSNWASRPGAHEEAVALLNEPGSLYDGKYRQILSSAQKVGLRPQDVFLPQRQRRVPGLLSDAD